MSANFVGDICMSDATKPKVYFPAKPVDITLNDQANPFVIEGELYDAEKGQSVSIRFVDGHYIVKEFSVKAVDLKGSDHVTPKVYLAQRMPGTRSFIPIVPLFSHQWQIYDFFLKVVYLP